MEETVRDGVEAGTEVAECSAMGGEEEEQCSYCLKLFTLSQLIWHVDVCLEKVSEAEVCHTCNICYKRE